MLSTTTQYALRALVALTRLDEGTAVLGRDLSDLSDVPANYLSKILLDLKRIVCRPTTCRRYSST
jgi:DNA-binding IscR family transcriptional regulator